MKLVRPAAVAIAALTPALAMAQEWEWRVGGGARAEFTDNYGMVAFGDTESGTTLSVAPFIVGYRRTETSQLNLLAGLAYNIVIGPDVDNYWSGRMSFDGSKVVERSSFGFNVGVYRDTTLRTETPQTGTVFANSVGTGITGAMNYSYQLAERWNVGAFASAYSNSYNELQSQPIGSTGLVDNDGYSIGGTLGYAWSERTQFTLATSYSTYTSSITDSDYVSTTLAATHQYSQKLTLSAYGGYFWSDTRTTQNVLVCPTTPIFCQLGIVQFVPVPLGSDQKTGGPLFGVSANYQITERTNFTFNASQNIVPSGTGVIDKATGIAAALNYSFSERLEGRLGASWVRSTVPALNQQTFRNEWYSFGGGISYRLTEGWLLDVGARRDHSDQRGAKADANVLFVQIAYNWPGLSMNNWAGYGAFSFPAAAPGAGAPPSVLPGQPMSAPVPVPESAEEPASRVGEEQ